MSTTQPIRNKKDLQNIKNFYKTEKRNLRNDAIITIGLHTALRINDILHLTYDMVYYKNEVRKYIVVKERKTGKENRILLNHEVRSVLMMYRKALSKTKMYRSGNPYLFPSPRKPDMPLSRSQAYRMICAAARASGIQEHISCHSLRKTFGYLAWKQGADPMVIMCIFNHSSLSVTKRYLCIDQDDKDSIFQHIVI